ncbi:MAG: hypothetical protein AB3N21_12550 [Ruegeria sp.]|uniref:hypothetical protein n=1 Tax=Ruegeria sp. TaxID=1879320 RepID=UPI00349E920F
MIVRCFGLLALTLLTACGSRIYDQSKPGEFTGSLLVMWVEGGGGEPGDGKFVYVPDLDRQGRALTFRRGAQTDGREVHIETIEPRLMYTDGGSVPRLVQPVKGLNPWGYAPAYMVHDWLFAANRCVNAKDANTDEAKVDGVTFRESFEIMAEMLKTLETQNPVAGSDVQPSAITWAVSSGISKRLWEDDTCPDPRIREDHEKQIKARLGIGVAGQQKSVRIAGENVPPARVVQVIEF